MCIISGTKIKKVAGGDDPNAPLYSKDYSYTTNESWHTNCVVKVLEYDGFRNGQNYYKVEYYYRPSTPKKYVIKS